MLFRPQTYRLFPAEAAIASAAERATPRLLRAEAPAERRRGLNQCRLAPTGPALETLHAIGIVPLCIHDSFIIPNAHESENGAAMQSIKITATTH
jgi:hypothetical protein